MADATGGPVDDDVAAAAVHGSYCPKLCTFACPVTTATGRQDAVPWSFHRVVADLAEERRAPDGATARALTACSGCLACRVPCEFDQDVPAQVRAGRRAVAAAGAPVPGARDAAAAVAAGDSPYWTPTVEAERPGGATCALVPGCQDGPETVAAAARLLRAAGDAVAVIPPAGCCGGVLADLGLEDAAREAAARLHESVPDGLPRIALDPHCLPTLRDDGAPATDLAAALHDRLADGRLRLAGPAVEIAYHDPCVQARRDDRCEDVRELLSAAGATVVEPEHAGTRTACSGAGMGMDLVDPDAAAATARIRADELVATGGAAVTGCTRARAALATAGADIVDLATFLADRVSRP